MIKSICLALYMIKSKRTAAHATDLGIHFSDRRELGNVSENPSGLVQHGTEEG